MIKSFDCVAMKHKAGAKISRRLSRMSPAQQLIYWQERHEKLIDLQENLRKTKSSIYKTYKRK